MKALATVLTATALATAIPLREGAAWKWIVHNEDSRTATVLSSAACDSGALWRIEGRNEGSGAFDTGTILERRNGSQAWIRPSRWLSWEPQPWNGQRTTTALDSVSRWTALPWGTASMIGPRNLSTASGTVLSLRDSTDATGTFTIRTVRTADSLIQFGLPSGSWSGGIPVRWRGRTANAMEEWMLSSVDGRDTTLPPDILRIPQVGTELVWEYDELGSIYMAPMPGAT